MCQSALKNDSRSSHCPPESEGILYQRSHRAERPSRSDQVWTAGSSASLCDNQSVTGKSKEKALKCLNQNVTDWSYVRMVQPSGSFLILSLRFINAKCPVVSPSTATMSVRYQMYKIWRFYAAKPTINNFIYFFFSCYVNLMDNKVIIFNSNKVFSFISI